MKILVRLPNWLGDIVMSTAFISVLKKRYPYAQIHVIVKKELIELIDFIPNVDEVHLFSKKSYPGTWGALRFGKQLRPFCFDLFFSLPDSFSSALIGYATKAKERVGFKNEMRSFLLTKAYKKPPGLHRVDEYLYLIERHTKHKDDMPVISLMPVGKVIDKRLMLINFNSEAASRRLPLNKAIRLTTSILSEFPDNRIGLIGSPKENAYITSILSGIPNAGRVINFAGKTSLKELVELLASCRVLLSTDSGPAHLANSLQTPCIVLFGAGNEKNTAPFNQKNLTIIRAGKLNCEPCVKNACPLYANPKCMDILDEEHIINELKIMLTQ